MTQPLPRRLWFTALPLLALLAACDSPGGAGGAVDEGLCGVPRGRISTVAAPIVNGTDSWTPSVVALTPAQGLAVGGIFTAGRFGGFELECTGTLIAPGVVLTAAHCLERDRGGFYTAAEVRFGVGADLATPRAMFDVSEAHVHPSYPSNQAADFAVLVLEQAATTTLGGEIAPIPHNCAPLPATGLVGEAVQTVGYGATDKYGQTYGTAQKWALEELAAVSGVAITVNGQNEAGVCYGDSGGPALFTLSDGAVYTLGVLSWGDAICTRFDHFMRTDRQCAFIDSFLPPPPPDPCDGVTAAGTCRDGAALTCDGTRVVADACAARGEVCAMKAGSARCEPPPVATGCGSETAAGRCAGTDAIFCLDGVVTTRDCAACGLTCGVVEALGGVDCVP